jgi:hypothetical protein
LQLGSPFDFQRQMKMFVVQKMPDRATPLITESWSIGSRISSNRPMGARLSFSQITGTCNRSQGRCRNFLRRTA